MKYLKKNSVTWLNKGVNKQRRQELHFMIRMGVAVPMIESRDFDETSSVLYDDHFTVQELIEEGLIRYVGRRNNQLYIRPLVKFRIFVNETQLLVPGEIVILELGETGRREFVEWSGD